MRTEPNGADQRVHVERGIAQLLNDMEIDRIRGEWMMNATETIDESWDVKNRYQDSDCNIRIANITEFMYIGTKYCY